MTFLRRKQRSHNGNFMYKAKIANESFFSAHQFLCFVLIYIFISDFSFWLYMRHNKTVRTTNWNWNKTVSKRFQTCFETVLFQFHFVVCGQLNLVSSLSVNFTAYIMHFGFDWLIDRIAYKKINRRPKSLLKSCVKSNWPSLIKTNSRSKCTNCLCSLA